MKMEETILSASDMLNQVMGRITKDSKQRKKERLRSNIKSLDDILHHFYAGSLITIGGASSNGKTALALNLLYELAVKQKHPSLFFSLEGTADSWTTRLLSLVTGIDTASLWEGNLNEDEWQKLDNGAKLLADAPIYLEAKKVNHIDKLCEVARQMKTAHGIHIIFVDYVQLLNAKDGYSDNRYLDLNYVTRRLKELAKELEVPVVMLSQLNRHLKDDEVLDGKKPRISDLRDSGTIEEDSDMVILVHHPELYHVYQDERGNDLHGMIQLIVAKNRMGALGECYVQYNASTGLMSERAAHVLPPPPPPSESIGALPF